MNLVNRRRLSGDSNRTSFTYTLDRLGYRGQYDVYDYMGEVGTNNDLGTRATRPETRDYRLIIHDAGRERAWPISDGTDWGFSKFDQAQWYVDWLGNYFLWGTRSLWLIGENIAERLGSSHPLLDIMDVQFIGPGQPPNPVDPLVHPLTNFTFYDGGATHFSEDFHLDAGCPEPRDYDDIGASGNGTLTHGWNNSTSNGCVVMSHLQDNTQYGYNTIFMSLNWFDISSFFTQSTDAPGQLLSNILNGLFPLGLNPDPEGDPCLAADTTATSVNQSTAVAAPKYLQLSQNTPNPFNPRTRIDFGLPADGHVALYIYDVQGRLVHTLVEAKMEAGYHHVEWDGTTRSGTDAATGIYWCKLASGGAASVRKMVLLR